jgi:Icc protein
VAVLGPLVEPADPPAPQPPVVSAQTEITTVGTDFAVLHRGAEVRRVDGLEPGTVHHVDGVEVRTLPHPGGEMLCRFATVNDVHFGETECGVIDSADVEPMLSSAPGEDPYPEMMNAAAVSEIRAIDPVAVIAKGDLTTHGTFDEYQAFLDCYLGAFGDRLHHVRGNHDAKDDKFAADPVQRIDLPGVTAAVLDTTIPGAPSGRITAEQLEWLDDLAAGTEVPVLVFGHHQPWDPGSQERPAGYFGINPDDSEALVGVIARRPAIRGYFAGHTHRNRLRRFAATGDVPYVEVACVKDFPGAWAEYQVHEGGIVQLHHRISTPQALAWTERTRAMFWGAYPEYSFGTIADRCFVIPATAA